MGMPMEVNIIIVTKGNELRLEENLFSLKKSGYRLYPLDVPIPVHKTKEADISGTAIIHKIEWEQGDTVITYRLISLNSTN